MKIFFNFTRYLLLIIGLFQVTSFYFSHAYANNWQKYPENPLIVHGNTDTWNSYFVRTPSAIYEDGTYKIWYDGFDGQAMRIGYAESSDGITWKQNIINTPVLSGDDENEDYAEPHVIKDGNLFKIWFLAIDRSTNNSFIKYSESIDGITWTSPTIVINRTQDWEEDFIAHPMVIKKDGKYELFYNGFSNGTWTIGTASSDDGRIWEKHQNNPVFTPDNTESPTVGAPSIVYENSNYLMYYHTNNPGGQIRLAKSINGVDWTREGIIFSRTPSSFDSNAIISPSITKIGNQYKMFYSGFDGNRWAIGVATSQIDNPTVPLLKQTSNPWQDDIYDRANLWSPSNTSMNRWGCAVTSATMVLQHHGYTKLPDNSPLDPGTLNTWLKNQRDGYVDNGLVNWHAISRLTKQARNINGITEFEALEFDRRGVNNALLESDLANNNPVILLQPGHFIVATEKQPTTVAINDPYHDRSTLANGYGNTYQALYRYIPSNTDLSTILLTFPTSMAVIIRDSGNNIVSDIYIQPAIAAPDSPTIKSGNDIKVLTVQKPATENYKIQYTSTIPQVFNITFFLYDENGEVVEKNINGFAHSGTNSLNLVFNKSDGGSNSLQKIVTYSTILKDLEIAFNNKLVHRGIYTPIKQLLTNSQKDSTKGRILAAKIFLYTTIQLTNNPANVLISKNYAATLNSDLKLLHSSF